MILRSPLVRSLFLVAVVVLFVISLGQRVGHRDGMILSVALALSIISMFIWYGDWRLVPKLKVELIEGQDAWGLVQALTELAQKARIPTPKLWLIDHPAPQALALGRGISSGQIFLTRGLLKHLSHRELRVVLAYHLACIKSRATLAFTVGSALADAVLSVGMACDWVISWLLGSKKSKDQNERRYFFTWLVAPLAAAVVRLAVGQRPYLDADRDAAQWLGEPQTLAEVLWKLQSFATTQPFQIAPAASHFFMVNPLTANAWGRYFHAHPEVRRRIENLIGHYPI